MVDTVALLAEEVSTALAPLRPRTPTETRIATLEFENQNLKYSLYVIGGLFVLLLLARR